MMQTDLELLLMGFGRRFLLVGLRFLDLRAVVVEVFSSFNSFHELDDLVRRVSDGVKSLTFHLLLPRLGCSEQEDIHQLVGSQRLLRVERAQVWNQLHVDSKDVLEVSSYLHIHRLVAITMQELLNTSESIARHALGSHVLHSR